MSALRNRLDPGSKIMAAQDFRHASQDENEKVEDFIRRLERLFKVAYGRDSLSSETRNAFLYGQPQEGFRYHLMEAPAVSGAPDYQALCLAAKTEEKRLAELKKCRQYTRGLRRSHPTGSPPQSSDKSNASGEKMNQPGHGAGGGAGAGAGGRVAKQRTAGRCWTCDRPGHKASECRSNPGKSLSGRQNQPRANQVETLEEEGKQPAAETTTTTTQSDPNQSTDSLQYLPDSDEEGVVRVTEVRVEDKGSRPQLARVNVSGVPLDGVVDTGADITIVGAEASSK